MARQGNWEFQEERRRREREKVTDGARNIRYKQCGRKPFTMYRAALFVLYIYSNAGRATRTRLKLRRLRKDATWTGYVVCRSVKCRPAAVTAIPIHLHSTANHSTKHLLPITHLTFTASSSSCSSPSKRCKIHSSALDPQSSLPRFIPPPRFAAHLNIVTNPLHPRWMLHVTSPIKCSSFVSFLNSSIFNV